MTDEWLFKSETYDNCNCAVHCRILGSGLLLTAGLWQLTPLKTICLRHCRSPIGFLSTHWRPGVGGAFRMGIEHG